MTDLFADVEAKSKAMWVLFAFWLDASVRQEQFVLQVLRDFTARIGDIEPQEFSGWALSTFDGNDWLLSSILDRIGSEVDQHLLQPWLVGFDHLLRDLTFLLDL